MNSRKGLPAACLALLALCFQAVPARGQGDLIWAADAEGGAPFIFKDRVNTAKYLGFEWDLAKALERELGRTIQFKPYDYKNLIRGLDRGDFHFAMNGLEMTPDRMQKVRFSIPYYIYKLQLVTRQDEDRFTDLDGLEKIGGTVGTLDDTAASRLLEAKGIKARLYDGQVEPYLDLAQGEIDAVLLDLPIALYYAKKSVVQDEDPGLKFMGEPFGAGFYGIAFRKGDDELAQEVDAALGRLMKKGVLKSIYEKWGLWTDYQTEYFGTGGLQEEEEQGVDNFWGLLLGGAWVTIQITVISFLLAMILGMLIALARLYGPGPIRWFAITYVEFFRGIPVMLLLIFMYYGLPEIGSAYGLGNALKMDAYMVAIVGFTLNYAAYEAEIYRAGIQSIPTGQWEAAGSLGMGSGLTFRRIIFPQAFRTILPPSTNDLVALFKDTSVVSVIALDPPELTKRYYLLARSGHNLIEIALATALLYLIMSVPLGYLSRYLEQKWGKHP